MGFSKAGLNEKSGEYEPKVGELERKFLKILAPAAYLLCLSFLSRPSGEAGVREL